MGVIRCEVWVLCCCLFNGTESVVLQKVASDVRPKGDTNATLGWAHTLEGLRVTPQQLTHQACKHTNAVPYHVL